MSTICGAAVRDWLRPGEHLQYERFEPIEFNAQPDTVVEVFRASGRATATGLPFDSEVVRIWTFRKTEGRPCAELLRCRELSCRSSHR